MTSAILSQIHSLVFHAAIPALVALLLGESVTLFMLAGVFIWSARTIFWIARIHKWAHGNLNLTMPEAPETLNEIAEKLLRNQQKAQKKNRKLEARLERFQEATSAMKDAIIIVDKKDRIEWWNQAGADMLDLVNADREQPIVNILRDPEFVEFYHTSRNAKPFVKETKNNKGILEYRVHRFGDGGRVIVARDITEREAFDQMRQTFLANASHELRTPVTVIHGYLETLQTQELPPTLRKALGTMHLQSTRMVELIEDLLTLSRLETSEASRSKKPIQVTHMLTQIHADAMTLSGDNDHTITLTIEPGLDIKGDESELRSALSNLVFNAVKYTPPKGKVEIELKALNQGATFSVTDTGDGIAAHHIPHLTERFYRVDEGRSRDTGGTGLGLAIVKHVLAHHNATLGISSTVGEGSRFSCVFPANRVINSPSELTDA